MATAVKDRRQGRQKASAAQVGERSHVGAKVALGPGEEPQTRNGPFGAFTDDVIDDRGLIDAKRFAHTLAVTVTDLARVFQQKPHTLNANPTSASIQTKGTMLLSTLNDLATFYQGKKLALRFLREPQPGLNDATPLALLLEGRLQQVCTFVDGALTLRPD